MTTLQEFGMSGQVIFIIACVSNAILIDSWHRYVDVVHQNGTIKSAPRTARPSTAFISCHLTMQLQYQYAI